MNCAQPGCLASVTWFGHPDDPALAAFAKTRGWAVLESAGWKCPRHQPTPSTQKDSNDDR